MASYSHSSVSGSSSTDDHTHYSNLGPSLSQHGLHPRQSSETTQTMLGGGGGGGRIGTDYSKGTSSRYGSSSSLIPPTVPFAPGGGSGSRSPTSRPRSLHYLPTKFSVPHKQGQWAHRKTKEGGGRAAFGAHESRMPDDGDEPQTSKAKKPKLLWNRFKWILFFANTLLMLYGLAGLICLLLVWFNIWPGADVIRTGDHDVLVISTIAASLCVLCAIIGYAGIVLNNRTFLAVYSFLLWICFAFVVTPGYMTYKQYAFNLEGKVNKQWSRDLGEQGRLRIQDQLHCCGYYSPYIEATVSSTCYSRSNLPGCKGRYWRFQKKVLKTWYICAFSLVPAQLFVMITALLCSNHVTYRFGKGLTPKQYRLDLGSLAYLMDGYAGEIAQAYGPDLAADAINRSSTNLELFSASSSARHRNLPGGSGSGFSSPKFGFKGGASPKGGNSPFGSRTDLHEGSLPATEYQMSQFNAGGSGAGGSSEQGSVGKKGWFGKKRD